MKKKVISFKSTSKKKTLIKEVKDLYVENYETLIKETENHLKKWKYIPYSWIGRFNIIKMAMVTVW